MRRRITSTLLAALLLAGCALKLPARSLAPAAPPSASTAVPAASAAPAALTAASPTPGPAAALREGLVRAAALDHYRMVIRVSGDLPEQWPMLRAKGAEPEYVYVRAGERAVVYGYHPLVPGFGATLDYGPRLLRDGDQHYVSGPLPLPAMDEEIWYSLGSSPPPFLKLPPDLAEALRLTTDGLALGGFTRTEEHDFYDTRCQVFRGDEFAAARILEGAGFAPGVLDIDPLDGQQGELRVEKTGAQLWLCADGVVRGVRAMAEGEYGSELDPTPFSLALSLAVFEQGPQVEVALPEQAVARTLTRESGTALVTHGGNVRAQPVDGARQDLVWAGETVHVYGKTADGGWYLVVTRRRYSGWISSTLLSVDPGVAAETPLVDPLSTVPTGLPPLAAVEPRPTPTGGRREYPRPTPLSGEPPPTPEGTRLFVAGPVELRTPASYAGGDMTGGGTEVFAAMRALGGPFQKAADDGAQLNMPLKMLLYDTRLGPSGVVTNMTLMQTVLPQGMLLEDYVQRQIAQFPPEVRVLAGGRTQRDFYMLEVRFMAGDKEVAQVLALYEYHGLDDAGQPETEVWIATFTTGATEWEQRSYELHGLAHGLHIQPH